MRRMRLYRNVLDPDCSRIAGVLQAVANQCLQAMQAVVRRERPADGSCGPLFETCCYAPCDSVGLRQPRRTRHLGIPWPTTVCHRYVRGGNEPEVVTSDVRISPPVMKLWETDVKRTSALRCLIEAAPIEPPLLTLEIYVQNDPVAHGFPAAVSKESGAIRQDLVGQSRHLH